MPLTITHRDREPMSFRVQLPAAFGGTLSANSRARYGTINRLRTCRSARSSPEAGLNLASVREDAIRIPTPADLAGTGNVIPEDAGELESRSDGWF